MKNITINGTNAADIGSLFCTEFVKLNKLIIQDLKLNFMKRRKISQKIIDKMEKDAQRRRKIIK